MKVEDESLWQQQVAALVRSDQGKDFLAFVEMWVNYAEGLMEADTSDTMAIADPAVAIRFSLGVPEDKFGQKTIGEIGHMLVVVLGHWLYREELSNGLTEIEKRLVQDIVSVNIALMQEAAAQQSGPDECLDVDSEPLPSPSD
jgi:hypothetical protein